MAVRHSEVIYGMKLLTTPDSKPLAEKAGKIDGLDLDLLLRRSLKSFDEALQSDQQLNSIAEIWNGISVCGEVVNSSIRWTFTCYCLKLLHILQENLRPKKSEIQDSKHGKEELNPKDQKESQGNESVQKESRVKVAERSNKEDPVILGVQDQKIVKTVLQFVVCLGVCPCLQTGVGIPLNMRSGFSVFVEEKSQTLYSSQYCLYTCLKVLLECVEVSAISSLVLSQHLTDILAGLLQIIHSKQNTNNQQNESGINESAVPIEKQRNRNEGPQNVNISKQEAISQLELSKNDNENSADTEFDHTTHDSKVTTDIEITDGTQSLDVDIDTCNTALHDLYARVYPPLLVKTLLLLQGGPKLKKPPPSKVPMLPPAPTWLRRTISQQLTKIAMKPRGVQFVLRGMLDGPGASAGICSVFVPGTADWRRCDAVAKVIACCPLQTVTLREYYKVIGPQVIDLLHLEDKQLSKQYLRIAFSTTVIDLLHLEDKQLNKQYLRIACSTISNMAQQDMSLTRQFIIVPILQPLLSCQADKELPDKSVMVSENDLSMCIEDIHKVFVCWISDNHKLILELEPVILILFKLLVFIKPGVSTLKKPCHEIVVTFLNHSEIDHGLACLDVMTFKQDVCVNLPRMHAYLNFQHGVNGGVEVTFVEDRREEQADNIQVDCVITILKDMYETELVGEFFVHMLKELTKVIQTEVNTADLETNKNTPSTILGEDATADLFYRRLTLLNMLARICEELGPDCIQSATHALEFVKATLERGVQVCRNTSDPMTEVFESETLSMAMGLLTATLTGAYQLSEENREFMNKFLPLLQEISDNHPESSVQEMATDIRIAIATHGAVWTDSARRSSKEFSRVADKLSQESKTVREKTIKENKPKIEVIGESFTNTTTNENNAKRSKIDQIGSSSVEKEKVKSEVVYNQVNDNVVDSQFVGEVNDTENTDRNNETTAQEGMEETTDTKPRVDSELTQAYKELCDPLLPVRGHGLIRLTRMVQRRDTEILQRQDAVLTIFLENLDHSDSYLYLAAVSGLAALSDLCPDLVLPKLCEQFANFDQLGKAGGSKRKIELRMKIGEVLVKASRCLGDTIPKYRDVLITSFLVGTKDTEPFVRASSLSNLGEICKLLRFSLGNMIHEVFECCSSLLRSDPDLEVRKAAGQAITLLLQGMSGDSFKILEDVIKDLYRALKQCMASEKEDGVKVHVTLALNELDDIMRKQLFPTQKLEKRIRVLDFD